MPKNSRFAQRLALQEIEPRLRELDGYRRDDALRELIRSPLTAEARSELVRRIVAWLRQRPSDEPLLEALLEEAADPALLEEVRALLPRPRISRGGHWYQHVDYGEGSKSWEERGSGGSATLAVPVDDEEPTRSPSRGPAAPKSTPPSRPADPPRSAYGLLQAPEMVMEGEEFELIVGLSQKPAPGVAGPPLERPKTSVGPYTLAVQIVAEGLRLRAGESWRREIWVTAEHPYPVFVLHLTSEPQNEPRKQREIRAVYSVDGQPLGFAYRALTVAWRGERAGEARKVSTGVNVAIPSAAKPADLTVLIHRSEEFRSRLRWTFETPHPLVLPDEVEPTEVGESPERFALDLMKDVNLREGKVGLFPLLLGKGRQVADSMPAEFWELFQQVAKRVEGPPSILILSEEPYVPWELAAVEPVLDAAAPPFLACQANVGRWVHPSRKKLPARQRPAQPPPTAVEVRDLSVVSGIYSRPGWQRLEQAEDEARQIAERYRAAPVDATTEEVLKVLGETPADLLHFSMHGKFDPNGVENGLILVDGIPLDPDQVKGSDLRRPAFVFLNACQVGQSEQVLGDYSGLAAAFLYAGAAAVVAPLWSIKDAVAKEIALDFYRQTLEGDAAPADVLRRVRAGFKTTAEAQSATALAYQFFGHPALRLHRHA